MRVPPRADGRDRLLVAGVLAMMLGLGMASSALVGPEPLPEETAAGSDPPVGIVLPGNAASPLAVGNRVGGDPACQPGRPHASRPGTVVRGSINDDPRGYLGKMAAMSRRHRVFADTTRVFADTTPGPYQASLNPAVYLAGVATPTTRHDGPVQAPPSPDGRRPHVSRCPLRRRRGHPARCTRCHLGVDRHDRMRSALLALEIPGEDALLRNRSATLSERAIQHQEHAQTGADIVE